jgi:uncharacterized repeat protein (TIGR02543 family)
MKACLFHFKYYFCFILIITSINHISSQTCTVTITNASIGGSAVLASNNYNSGSQRTWSQNGVNYGGKDITCNSSNIPISGSTFCQYVKTSNLAVIYNRTAMPGRITSIQATGTASLTSTCLAGTFKLVNDMPASYGSSGNYFGSNPQTSTNYIWTAGASDNYNFFCIQRSGTSSQIQYFSSIVITHERAKVAFNSNGGSGSMPEQTSCTAQNLTMNSFTRTGYTFSGWNTEANGSGTAYTNGASYSFSSSATLYAQWRCISNPSAPTVTSASRCGSGAITLSASPGSGETIDWYNASTDGALLASGSATYSPIIPSTTTYYVQARNLSTGCLSTTRTPVTATIKPLPNITITASPSNAIVCSGSNVSLTASGANSYSWNGGINNGVSFSISTTTTYIVTATGANGCSDTASKTVYYYPASSSATLINSSIYAAEEQCTESNGWSYYADPETPGQYIFGIYKNGNSFSANVDLIVNNVSTHLKSSSSNGANQEHASYTMSRYWNVNATGSVGSGVKVRFFIDPQDTATLLNARNSDYNVLKNTTNPNTLAVKSRFEWFKTQGVPYTPLNWLGNKYNSNLIKLTQDTIATMNGKTYVELSGITSFSGGTGGAAFGPSNNGLFNSGGMVGLPVSWKYVKAIVKEEGNWIQWITSSEKNTSHFEVEYSYDAKNFFKASNDIKAAGNSTTDKSYNYMHLEEYGDWVYYRIKQVDLDGKVDYSKIVNVKRTSKLPEFQVSMYPVPLNVQDLNLKIQTIQKTDITITINDLLGRGVYAERVSPQGYTTEHKMSLGHLQNGTYYVTIDNGLNKSVQVLVIGK